MRMHMRMHMHMHMRMGHLVGRARVRPEEEQPVELRRDVDLGRLEMRAALLRTRHLVRVRVRVRVWVRVRVRVRVRGSHLAARPQYP